jgi:hypothetical protein
MGSSAGGAAVAGSVFGKLAIGAAAAALVAGGGVAAISTHPWQPSPPPARAATVPAAPRPAPASALAAQAATAKLAPAPGRGAAGDHATTTRPVKAKRATPAPRAAAHKSTPARGSEHPTKSSSAHVIHHPSGKKARRGAKAAKPVHAVAAPKQAAKARGADPAKPSKGRRHPQAPANDVASTGKQQTTRPSKAPAPATPPPAKAQTPSGR